MNKLVFEDFCNDESILKVDDSTSYFFQFPGLNGIIRFQYSHSSESYSESLPDNDFLHVSFIKGRPDLYNKQPELIREVEDLELALLANHESVEPEQSHGYAVLFRLKVSKDLNSIHVSAEGYEEGETRFNNILPVNIIL